MELGRVRARDIMLRSVVTIGPDESLAIAKLKTVRRGVGGLPVVVGDKLVGIITHRDVVLAGERYRNLKVCDIMSKEIVTVGENSSLKEIVSIMRDKGYQRIPVVRGRKLVGLITQSSVIDALAEALG